MKTVDARGLSCPEPVLLSKQAAKEGEFPFCVLVDDITPFENIQRFAVNNGYMIDAKDKGNNEYEITFTK